VGVSLGEFLSVVPDFIAGVVEIRAHPLTMTSRTTRIPAIVPGLYIDKD
jgi:hypothetical protein